MGSIGPALEIVGLRDADVAGVARSAIGKGLGCNGFLVFGVNLTEIRRYAKPISATLPHSMEERESCGQFQEQRRVRPNWLMGKHLAGVSQRHSLS